MKNPAFLALPPPVGLTTRLATFQRDNRAGHQVPELKFVPWFKWHLTLFYWPDLPTGEVNTLKTALLGHKFEPVQSQVKGFHFFQGAQVLYLKEVDPKMNALHEKLTRLFKGSGIDAGTDRPLFIPHWTLARKFKPGLLQHRIRYFRELDCFSFSGIIDQIVLYRTLPNRYTTVFSIPLRKR